MKVEQRIGRIDRIGQKHDPVRIINYFYEDTVETKIYDRLGDRINDFEEVVGTMQPILSGVEGSIQELTLDEGVSRTSTSADIDKALKDFEDEIDEKEQEMEDETVDIGESLEDTELDSREEVRADALLDARKDSVHPDIGKLTEETYPYQAPFTPEAVEEVLTKSRILRNKGIVFESATEIEKDVSLEESDLEEMYLVKLQDDFVPENLQEEHQDTVAYELAPESDRFVVTFDPNCADDFPSVRYLMSGDFLFESLVEEILDSQERAISLEEEMVGETDGEYCVPVYAEPYVVRGWFNGEKGVGLDQNGEISSKGYTEDDLHNWCSEFRENR
jgi:hypothetical protein